VRSFCLGLGLLVCALIPLAVRAETFKLANGETISGELLAASANDQGVQIKVAEGKYERVSWDKFSQEDLRKLSAQNKKLEPLIEPFIEVTQEEKIQKTEVNPKEPPRLERPSAQSLFGALMGSGLGLVILLLLYAANLYAAYEICRFRGQFLPLVLGVSALVPIVGPIVFLSIPTRYGQQAAEAAWDTPPQDVTPATDAGNPMQAEGAEHSSGLKLAQAETAQATSALPPTQTFQRGQFTFNRRFFETKFPGFFGAIRRDAERDLVLVVKAARGEHHGQRITRIAANELHLQVQKGHASEEVMIPFIEIQEVRLKHKDA
jgi:hypothetical protein